MISTLEHLLEPEPRCHFKSTTVKVPGKLYLAGEYAVLEPGHPAVIMAVDHYLTATVKASHLVGEGSFSSDLLGLDDLHYKRLKMDNPLSFDQIGAPGWEYVLSGIEVVEQLLNELERPLLDYHLTFKTDLVAENGDKYGLGSSGAVTVATIRSLLSLYGFNVLKPELVYKLSAIAMTLMKSEGSFGDIASNVLGGWVYYQSPDRKWLKNQLEQKVSLQQLLLTDWPDLTLQSLPPVEDLEVMIGWTKTPASTPYFVKSLQDHIQQEADYYQQFLKEAKESVIRLKEGFVTQNIPKIQEEVMNYRHLLLHLGEHYQLNIETDTLNQLVEIAQANQYSAKSSGAGGGDCGIAIGSSKNKGNGQRLKEQWEEAEIVPLALQIAPQLFK
ncbi:phosphomevalonate kinase [Dolosicoccus paucivorans]|uniref:phosphomevalonate kinase n=1 Tax=Dolosicoccus paucivorans TaxID=84521 RepID=A0A2N6SML7_9LACT|nr:phosphomevalonate kinase [Dolosicoccus paucivorans]PMB84068.1 phosphomevalonate kinase [Dolosicoccus paucivorans]PMC58325.1 phosphomevalonate kinase [Dolosicoccus paucivorans]